MAKVDPKIIGVYWRTVEVTKKDGLSISCWSGPFKTLKGAKVSIAKLNKKRSICVECLEITPDGNCFRR